ncbi:MAG: hypothetical protein ACLTJG_05795 [[Clostridium] innocuum]
MCRLEGAVRRSAQPLLEQDYLSEQYITQMIRNVKQWDRISCWPGLCLAHESPDVGGRKLGMQLIRLKHPVPVHSQFYDRWILYAACPR